MLTGLTGLARPSLTLPPRALRPQRKTPWSTLALAWGTLGVVYGDIGTSPLYVYSSIFASVAEPTRDDLFGAGEKQASHVRPALLRAGVC